MTLLQTSVGTPEGEPHQFNQGFTLQGVSILVGLFIAVLTIIGFFSRWMRTHVGDLKDEIGKHNETVEKRLGAVETKIIDFMPRTEIEAKIEHEKNNRATADAALKLTVDRHAEAITNILVDQGKMHERHANLASAMEEIKTLVKEQGKDLGARLDKIQDAVSQGART